MRACENRFLVVCFVLPTSSLTDWLAVCELALSSLFPLADCDSGYSYVLNIMDTSSYNGVILVCIIFHTNVFLFPDITR